MSEQTVPRETSSASLRHSRAAEGVGGEEEGGSSSKSHQQPFSSSSRGGGLVGQQQGPSSTSSSGQQSSSTEFGDAAQYQELNPIGEGNIRCSLFVTRSTSIYAAQWYQESRLKTHCRRYMKSQFRDLVCFASLSPLHELLSKMAFY